MKAVKTLAPLDRGIVGQWESDGVPVDRTTRDYLADHIFPVMVSELDYWRSLALELSGNPETRYARCSRCGLLIGGDAA